MNLLATNPASARPVHYLPLNYREEEVPTSPLRVLSAFVVHLIPPPKFFPENYFRGENLSRSGLLGEHPQKIVGGERHDLSLTPR
jgi:hypothetical protein